MSFQASALPLDQEDWLVALERFYRPTTSKAFGAK
jgi:hypothetical protein